MREIKRTAGEKGEECRISELGKEEKIYTENNNSSDIMKLILEATR